MANLLKQHEFWLGMFIIALCLLLGWRSEIFHFRQSLRPR